MCLNFGEKRTMNQTEHGHENYGIDSAYSLRPCKPYTHQHERGEKQHIHIGITQRDGSLTTAGARVHAYKGAELDAELLRRASEAYPALSPLIEQVRSVGLRSDECEALRTQLADAMDDGGAGRLTGADVSQIRSATFERMGF